MYKTCPKCKYKRQNTDTADPGTCPACGLIFSKWMKHKFLSPLAKTRTESNDNESGFLHLLINNLLYVEPKTDPVYFYGRALIYIFFFIWGWQFILMDFRTNEIGASFMHNINLVFHEAGHVIFQPFGRFITILGGTLGQLLMPLIVMFTFIFKQQNNFNASIGLWWFGQSLMECAPYINDANDLKLILLGGVTGLDKPGSHDWQNILWDIGLYDYERELAAGADMLGSAIIITAFIWGGYILYQQFRNSH